MSICAKLLNKGILVPVVILFTALAIGCSDEPEEPADINATVEARVAQRLGTQEAMEASAPIVTPTPLPTAALTPMPQGDIRVHMCQVAQQRYISAGRHSIHGIGDWMQ